MSAKDKLERKKYMVMWTWGSELMARIMSRFLSTETTNTDRNNPDRMHCFSESWENPRSKTSKTRI